MFTGIVEEKGILKKLEIKSQGALLTIQAKLILNDIKVGDSIAVNGACLTVTSFSEREFKAELSSETLKRTAISRNSGMNIVNLERALRLGDRLGGHIVSGHIDCIGKLIGSSPSGDNRVLEFEYPQEYEKYMVLKGSITVDGISLTLASLMDNRFQIWVIPHTIMNTTLENMTKGTWVNLEFDILGKYVERLMDKKNKTVGLSRDFLSENGFI